MGTIAQDFTTDAVVSYTSANGTYTFSPACNVLRVSHKPIMDQAKRTVTHTLHTFILEDTLQATDQLDATKVNTAAIRLILNYPGCSVSQRKPRHCWRKCGAVWAKASNDEAAAGLHSAPP